jgi:hypothetical protein
MKIGNIASVLLLLCSFAGNLPAQVTNTFQCIAEGTWNSGGVHTATNGSYMIGYNYEYPVEQAAYFLFDLSSIQGKTVTGCSLYIPGSIDYLITDYWGTPTANNRNDHQQFKVGIAPQCANVTNGAANFVPLGTITNAATAGNVYHYCMDANDNQDLGYGWVQDGLHFGMHFDAFTYNTGRLQAEVNAGGVWAFWACDRFDSGAGAQNYLWGSTFSTTNIVLTIITSN